MNELRTVKSISDIYNIYDQMDTIFGKQDHIPADILLDISKEFPSFIQIILSEEIEQLGHIVYIPFNESGYKKMLDSNFDEEDIKKEDIFQKDIDEKLFVFVYSIYSKSKFLTKSLIETTVNELKDYQNSFSNESFIFAEVVSRPGQLLAERMSLREYHSYIFRGEKLSLFKTEVSSFIDSF